MKYYTSLDRDLHNLILKYADNTFIKQLMGNLIDHIHRIRIQTSNEPLNYTDAITEHLEIIDAFLEKDICKIEKCVKKHLETSKKNALKYFNHQYENML